MKKEIEIDEHKFKFNVINKTANKIDIEYNGQRYCFSLKEDGILFNENTREQLVFYSQEDKINEQFQVVTNFGDFSIKHKGRGSSRGVKGHSPGSMTSPMPGKVFKVLVSSGQKVNKGDGLIILEAMKMEHLIRAPYDGEVEKILYSEGMQVNANAELIKLKEIK